MYIHHAPQIILTIQNPLQSRRSYYVHSRQPTLTILNRLSKLISPWEKGGCKREREIEEEVTEKEKKPDQLGWKLWALTTLT